MKDYRIEVKIKNNLLWQAMQSKGIKNAAQLARAVDLTPSLIGRYLNLQEPVYTKQGDYKPSFMKICDFFEMIPVDLYPEERMNDPLLKNKGAIEIGKSELKQLIVKESDPLALLHQDRRSDAVHELLGMLRKKEADILAKSMGIGGGECTMAEIAEEYGISTARVYQIRDKAIRRLKYPPRLSAVGFDWETGDLIE